MRATISTPARAGDNQERSRACVRPRGGVRLEAEELRQQRAAQSPSRSSPPRQLDDDDGGDDEGGDGDEGASGGDPGTARPQGVTGGGVTGPGGGGGVTGGGVTGPGGGGGVTGGGVTGPGGGGGVTGGGVTGGGVTGGGVTGPVTAARRVRLVGAGGPCEGLVQMRHGERWDALCVSGWNASGRLAEELCQGAGCGPPKMDAGSLSPQLYGGDLLYPSVRCLGEFVSRCAACPVLRCSWESAATLGCEPDPATTTDEVTWPRVRVLGGWGPCQGHLEALHAGSWRGVCAQGLDASLTCAQLQCPTDEVKVTEREFDPAALDPDPYRWVAQAPCTGERGERGEQATHRCRDLLAWSDVSTCPGNRSAFISCQTATRTPIPRGGAARSITRPLAELTARPTVELTARLTMELAAGPTVELKARLTVELTAEPTVELTAEPTVELTAGPTVRLNGRPKEVLTLGPTVELTAGPTVELAVGPKEALTLGPMARLNGRPTVQVRAGPKVELTVGSLVERLLVEGPLVEGPLVEGPLVEGARAESTATA
ncbi:unnamed protein product [Lampetra planeri]